MKIYTVECSNNNNNNDNNYNDECSDKHFYSKYTYTRVVMV